MREARVQLMSNRMRLEWMQAVFNSLFVLFHLPLMSRSHRLMLTHARITTSAKSPSERMHNAAPFGA